MDQFDFTIITDVEASWKMVSTLSPEEISALISNSDTRMSDVIGKKPVDVIVALGEEFVPPKQFAEFRTKFRPEKGITVFEIGWFGHEFALQYLWGDLVGEVGRRDSSGPVGVALREALGRMARNSKWKDVVSFLSDLDDEVHRRMRKVACQRTHEQEEEPFAGGGADKVGGVPDYRVQVLGFVDLVTRDLKTIPSPPPPRDLWDLPVVLLHCGQVDHTRLSAFLERKFRYSSSDLHVLFKSLFLFSSPHDDPSSYGPVLHAFLCDHFVGIPPEWIPVAEVILEAPREQIAAAAAPFLRLASDVCVGRVFLNLLTTTTQRPTTNAEKDTWKMIATDVIINTPCCDLPAVLQQLRQHMNGEELLREVLTSADVLRGWRRLWASVNRRKGDQINSCAVSHLLAFYFSVFGLNLEWMRMFDAVEGKTARGILQEKTPVEIASALEGNPEWYRLLRPFQQMLKEHLRSLNFDSVGHVGLGYSFRTEEEWAVFLSCIHGEALLPWIPDECRQILPSVVAPFIRALLKYGEVWTKSRLTAELWNEIPSVVEHRGVSADPLGSLLHSAIQLEELEEVKRRAFPGLVKWRNADGETALQLAQEKYDEDHPIRVHLEQLTRSFKQPNSQRLPSLQKLAL